MKQGIDDQVARLTRGQRSLRAMAAINAAILIVALVSAQSRPSGAPNEFRAQRFVLVDEGDQELAELGVAPEDGSVRLVIRHGAGAWVGVRGDGTPALALLRPSGIARVALDGGDTECGLRLFGDKDVDYVSLRTAPDSSSALKMLGSNGKQRILLGTETKGDRTGLYLSDIHGVNRASAYIESESDFGFSTRDGDGKVTWKR